MIRILLIIVFFFSSFGLNIAYAEENTDIFTAKSAEVPEGAARLIAAYPEQNIRYENNMIIFPDGYSIVFDDGTEKSFEEKLDNADVEDMFSLVYDLSSKPSYLADAGRSRCDALFKKMYGSQAREVKKSLVTVRWFGQRLKFTKINGAAIQLQKVADELARDYPEFKKYMVSSGTFNWRKVRHANRQSSHSYGIAIDIAVPYSHYWRWSYPKAKETEKIAYKNKIPFEIVDVFEKHGFIWGGRWYHFDTMHFEYRPEIAGIRVNH